MPVRTSLHEKPGTCPAFLSVCFTIALFAHQVHTARSLLSLIRSKESGRFYLSIRFLPLVDIWTMLALATKRSNGCEFDL
jgi:hypothetical protein